jgi:hypothetical protein
MGAVPLHTTVGNSCPRCTSTCPQAHRIEPSPDDGVCHHIGASSLTTPVQLVTPQHPPTDTSLPMVISPALDEPALSASLPRTCEVPHLHMQKTTTTDSISIYIIYIWTDISKDNINKKHTNILNIPRWSKTSPGGNTMSGSPWKSTPA